MDKSDRDRNPELTEFKDNADTGEPKVAESTAKSNSSMPKFQIDPSVFEEMPGTHFPAMQAKKKRSGKAVWVTLLLLVLLGVGGYFGYTYWQNEGSQLTQKDAQIISLNAENAKLKTDLATAQKAATPTDLTPADKTAADKTVITAVVTAKLHAPTKSKDEKLTVNVMKQNETFAYVNAGPTSGGAAAYILKKVEGQWTIIFSGQDKVSQDVIDTYSIPTEFQSGQ